MPEIHNANGFLSQRDEQSAIANALGRERARLLAAEIALAVEYHPELIKDALKNAFDLTAVEESTNRQMIVLTRVFERCLDLQSQVKRLEANASRLVDSLEKCRADCERKLNDMAKRLKAAREYAVKWENELRKHGLNGVHK